MPIVAVCEINPPKPKGDAVPPQTPVTFVRMAAVDADAGAITDPQTRSFAEARNGFTSFRNDDVILAKITPCFENGKAAICRGLLNGLGFGSTEFHALRSKGAVLPEYLYHFVRQKSFCHDGQQNMTGSVGQKRVPATWLSAVPIPLPPLAEQKRIVAKVEEVLARVNAARRRLAKVPAILKRFRQAVLAAACSGRLTADWREGGSDLESVQDLIHRLRLQRGILRSDLGLLDLPAGWSWTNLKTLMDPQEPFCYGVVQPGTDDPDGVFLVRAGDLEDGSVNMSNLRRIPRSVDTAYRRSRLRGGELLVTVVGAGIGESAIAPERCSGYNIARAVAKIPIRHFSPRYVRLWMESETARGWMDADAREVARPTLNLEQLQTLPVPVPPEAEQNEIVRRVEGIFSLVDSAEARVAAGMRRAEKMVQAVLAKAFRGELVPTEAELAEKEGRGFESAEQLLARIRAARQAASAASVSAPRRSGRPRPRRSSAAPGITPA